MAANMGMVTHNAGRSPMTQSLGCLPLKKAHSTDQQLRRARMMTDKRVIRNRAVDRYPRGRLAPAIAW